MPNIFSFNHPSFSINHPSFCINHPSFCINHPSFCINHPSFSIYHSGFSANHPSFFALQNIVAYLYLNIFKIVSKIKEVMGHDKFFNTDFNIFLNP